MVAARKGPGSISIHALREEGDDDAAKPELVSTGFLSTPSARRATGHAMLMEVGPDISIHALREEGDALSALARVLSPGFLSTPSARRATG